MKFIISCCFFLNNTAALYLRIGILLSLFFESEAIDIVIFYQNPKITK